ncbi:MULTISPECIES: hormogonium polysaccharide secretion pseudopilin HpsC [unclassified Microcoleus]|uniref:hormogonium polysaccharide secretion pseudopilin HpsC n=1 Tax=unclassified Microcoleus TaxID=2642155 RepID=UPI002FD4865B
MKTLLRLLLKSQHQQNRSRPTKTEKGMTLVELLVGSIMAFLIITPMLAFVVDMLNTDRKEQLKANTEQDIQAAVDFIAQDLSQAIYIYDGAGVNAIKSQLPAPNDATKTPILVFWKRQLVKQSIPVDSSTVKPKDCAPTNNDDYANKKCNDTYVLSLVAYYQFKEADPQSIWCQPSGGTCPTRIARYEIKDGIRKPDPTAADTILPYYNLADTKTSQQPDPAFNKYFEFTKPTEKVTTGTGFEDPQVLVNYIDHSSNTNTNLPGNECQMALGNPTIKIGTTTSPIPEDTLKITDSNSNQTNSFYACVDTAKNTARVTIRGNSLRRLQADKANFNPNNSAFFPRSSVQVKGLSGLGK